MTRRRRVIAAVDNSLAARPVLQAALAMAPLFGAAIEVVHVKEDGDAAARAAAEAAGVPFRTTRGPTVRALIRAARSGDVSVLVLGARGRPRGPRPAGHTALEVIASLTKPLLVVPPDLPDPYTIASVLVPLDATRATAAALRWTIKLACTRGLKVLVLHVYDEDSIPSFDDQTQHETDAWVNEFVARYCPPGLDSLKIELRVGVPAEHVLDVAEQARVDLIALGWAQDLRPGRAAVVREVVACSRIPVLLVPVFSRFRSEARLAS
jgi:nucleotide-binding universal stress UspA family protein